MDSADFGNSSVPTAVDLGKRAGQFAGFEAGLAGRLAVTLRVCTAGYLLFFHVGRPVGAGGVASRGRWGSRAGPVLWAKRCKPGPLGPRLDKWDDLGRLVVAAIGFLRQGPAWPGHRAWRFNVRSTMSAPDALAVWVM
jgi:hypothetical protein